MDTDIHFSDDTYWSTSLCCDCLCSCWM